MTIQDRLKSNIWKLSVITILQWFLLTIPIIVVYYQQNGLSMKEVFLLQSIFSIGVVVFEIPSGYFADVFGRKNSLVLGCVFAFLGFAIYAVSGGFWGFLAAELTLGFGSSFISGADSALLFDSLTVLERGEEYKKLEGRIGALGNFSEAAASLIGGSLAAISIHLPFYIQAALLFCAIPIVLTIYEPPVQKHDNKDGAWKGILKIVKYCLHHHAETKWLIIHGGLLGASTLTLVWFIQPYFQVSHLPLVYFGVAWAILNLSVGVFSLGAHHVEKFFGRKITLIGLFGLIFLCYFLVSQFQALWAIPFLLIAYFVRAINGPVLKDLINRVTASHIRATVLSVRALVGRFIFAIIGPLVGWISDSYSLSTALLLTGCLFLVFGTISTIFLLKHKVI